MKVIKTTLKFALMGLAGLFALAIIVNLFQTPEQRAKIAASNEKTRLDRVAQETIAAQKATEAKEAERKKKIEDAWQAPALMSFYNKNEVKADQNLKGQRITVSGKVDKIGKDILDTPYVTLKTNDLIASVQVMFPRRDESAIADLVPGHSVVLEGKVSGKMMNVILQDGAVIAE